MATPPTTERTMVTDMMQIEFERLAGYEVSEEDYRTIIEPMYMATNLDKSEFIKVIDRKRFEIKKQKSEEQIQMENELLEEKKNLKEDIKWYQERINSYKSMLETETEENWIQEWKSGIKRFKEEIKSCKRRITEINWVLS